MGACGSFLAKKYAPPHGISIKVSPSTVQRELSRSHVLLIDDDTITLKFYKRLCERNDCKVTTIKDGTQAVAAIGLATLTQDPITFVLCDKEMSECDGFETVCEIAKIIAPPPIFIHTGTLEVGDQVKFTKAGAVSVVTKPLTDANVILYIALSRELNRNKV